MEKGGDLRHGGSSRFIRQTGGDSDLLLDKSSKKEKVRRLSCVGVLSHSNSTTKGLKVHKKFSTINHASPPRKLRSAMKKRQHESPVALDSIDEKKHKATAPESIITKDEEEVAEALFALAQTFTDTDRNTTPEVEPSSMHMEPPNEAKDINDDVSKSRKRCSVHVYICRFIKFLQTTESDGLGIDQEGARVISDTNPQKITNGQEQQQAFHIVGDGCGVEGSSNVVETPTTTREATSNHRTSSFDAHLSTAAAEQVLPYFDTIGINHDHSRWSIKQQSWGNQFTSNGCYPHWQNQRHNTMATLSASSVELFGTKYTRGSLLQVLGSEHAEQQRQRISMSLLASDKGKMPFTDPPPGYDEKGGLFFVDSGPTLKLSL